MSIVGIDLGTTFSAISVVRDGVPVILPVHKERIMPSVVGLSPEDRWLVGRPALNQWTLYPERTVRSIKRKMGSNETVVLGTQTFTPQQISAMILRMLKSAAQQQLGEEVKQAVITVPAYFTDTQRQATREAGEIAGLEVVRIINEPTAAALAYGLQSQNDEVALVYDLGGGTFDVSLVEMSGGVVDVRASHGNTQLGGDDFDERLTEWLIAQFEEQHSVDLRAEPQARARVRRAAEDAKITLSSQPFAWVREEYLIQKRGVPLHMEIEVSRLQFVNLIEDLLQSTMDSVERVLEDAEIEQPDHVMLVGGSTYIPAIWDMVADRVGITPRQDVNPSEAVALGAGAQGAIIAGDPIDAILVDVTPHSLGIATAYITPVGDVVPDIFKPLIHRNTTIPTVQREVFTALTPDQTAVEVEIYQGESPIASDNALLGKFKFEGLRPEKAGELPRITVQFDMDVSGLLTVQVVDRGSGKEAEVTVEAAHQRLSQQDIKSAQIALPDFDLSEMDEFAFYNNEAEEGEGEDSEEVVELPKALVREATVLLARARKVGSEKITSEVEAVEKALGEGDESALTAAVETLNDALFELEE